MANQQGLIRQRALKAVQIQNWSAAAVAYAELLSMPESSDGSQADDACNQGAVLRKLGRLTQAIEHYQHWLPQFSHHLELRLNAVNCALELGEVALAEQWAETGLAQAPNNVSLRQAQARIFLHKGDPTLARQLLEAMCREDPQRPGVWMDLALVTHRQGEFGLALEASQRATALDPKNGGAWGNQISMLRELGRIDQAETLVASLSTEIRQHLGVRRAVADLLMEQQLMVEAETEFNHLCSVQPLEASNWLNRAACLRQLKQYLAAVAVLKSGLRWKPHDRDLQEALGHCLAEIGKPNQGMALLRRALTWDHTLSDASHTGLQFLGAGYKLLDSAERAELSKAWERRKQQEGAGPLWPDMVRPALDGRRLRVGYFSADMCDHPVGRFLLPLLEAHNRSQVELWGLSCGPHHDTHTDDLRRHCDHWLELRYGSDQEVARILADQNLDVIVELGGFTGHSRIGSLIYRPAPLQLSYLGYPAPTYLEAIDGWIGDDVLFSQIDEVDQKAHHLITIEGGYMTYQDHRLPRVARHREEGPFRFGSFNHSRKLSDEAVSLFARVLQAAPDSELVLKSVSFVEIAERQRIKRIFERAGIEPQRLITLPWVEGRGQHLASYAEMDVALDPLPYSGATTSCEALSMGIPVVTLAGEGMVSRLSASVLAHSGCSEWIATTPEQYVQIALGLAEIGPRDAGNRLQLRQKVLKSPLGNANRLAKEIESKLQELASERLAVFA